MKSPKESPLAVSYFLPEISFLKREAKIYADESGISSFNTPERQLFKNASILKHLPNFLS